MVEKRNPGNDLYDYTMDEIVEKFDAIKDHKPKAPKKLNELGRILASAYLLDPDKADDMWQYLVELNVRENLKNAKFYIAQVFNKIMGLISTEEATDFIMMTPERVELMLMYGYDGITLYKVLGTLTRGFLQSNSVDNIVISLEYVFEKFGGINSGNIQILKAVQIVIQSGADLLNEHTEYKEAVMDLVSELMLLDDEKVAAYGKVNGVVLGIIKENNLEELLDAAIEYSFHQEFLELLWMGRDHMSLNELQRKWEEFVEYLPDNIQLPVPEEEGDETNYEHSKMKFYVEIISDSVPLLNAYFDRNSGYTFKRCIIYKWVEEQEWEKMAEYISKGLLALEDSNMFDYGYMKMLTPFMEGYFMNEHVDFRDYWGNSVKIINKNNVEKFADALCKASVMSIGGKFQKEYHLKIKSFIEKTIGNYDVLEKYGFEEKKNNKTSLERLKKYAQDFIISGRSELDHLALEELSVINCDILREYSGKFNQEDIYYHIVCEDIIAQFFYQHCRQEVARKGKMLAACITHGDIERAIEIISMMKATKSYEDYYNPNSWECSFENTLLFCIRELDMGISEQKKGITQETIQNCVQIVNLGIPSLTQNSANKLTAELKKLYRNREEDDEYIRQLMNAVDLYCTFPKPVGKGSASNINNLSSQIWNSFAILSKMKRVDVICQIMNKFMAIRDILKPVTYPTWVKLMVQDIEDRDCMEIFKYHREIYEAWFETNTREYDVKELAKKIGKFCTQEEYEVFEEMVFRRVGVVDGLNEYFKEDLRE